LQVVGDQPVGNEGILLQELAHQFQRGLLVSLGLDQHIEDLAFGVDGPPKVDHPALSRQISIGHFRRRVRPSVSMIREQKQCSSSPARRASRQYKIYSDNALSNAQS